MAASGGNLAGDDSHASAFQMSRASDRAFTGKWRAIAGLFQTGSRVRNAPEVSNLEQTGINPKVRLTEG